MWLSLASPDPQHPRQHRLPRANHPRAYSATSQGALGPISIVLGVGTFLPFDHCKVVSVAALAQTTPVHSHFTNCSLILLALD
jgi:hypothetical protein